MFEDEISERSKRVLPEVQASHSTFSVSVQGGKGASDGLGEQASRKEEAWVWRAKVPGAQADSKDDQEVDSQAEMPRL